MVKLGNRVVMQIRRDLFDHLQRLSLHFYSKERTGGIVWRLIHEVHGVNRLVDAGVVLVGLDAIQLGHRVFSAGAYFGAAHAGRAGDPTAVCADL